jgi:hypothetical protein
MITSSHHARFEYPSANANIPDFISASLDLLVTTTPQQTPTFDKTHAPSPKTF